MRMVVFLFFMGRMHMLMGTMFPGVFVIMDMDIPGMFVKVGMLVDVLMRVGVHVLVRVRHISMPVLMVVFVGMFMGMQVLVFVLTFHNRPSRWSFYGAFKRLTGEGIPGPGSPGS
jgi:hypothetical protein